MIKYLSLLFLGVFVSIALVKAQPGFGIGVDVPLERLEVSGAIKIGTDYNNNPTTAPAGGAGTIRWDGTNFQGWDGTRWITFAGSGFSVAELKDADEDTKVQVEESPDEDIIRFDLAGLEHFTMVGPKLNVLNSGQSVFIGQNAGAADNLTNNNNVAIGYNAFPVSVNNTLNTHIGYNSGLVTTGSTGNTAIGASTMQNNVSGLYNSAIGVDALRLNIDGDYNVAAGSAALFGNTTGGNNVGIGTATLGDNTSGDNNVGVGYQALRENTTASGNVGIGYQAGFNNLIGTGLTG